MMEEDFNENKYSPSKENKYSNNGSKITLFT